MTVLFDEAVHWIDGDYRRSGVSQVESDGNVSRVCYGKLNFARLCTRQPNFYLMERQGDFSQRVVVFFFIRHFLSVVGTIALLTGFHQNELRAVEPIDKK
ncbi:hypothetical protein T4A_9235 [Trichinella pseudospiralis]|uniref:Uncharacterized protein n=1 Tax=Trichinella pseudospiralis TaxID=6337 RepID=A0A0V1EIL2_TRIPS|nr:hypothetical protein T4A_9235 [Trichinella pseudospiralis]KRZ37653.1 hypothetical protein T4C_8413 [Trichinella pseudospiralis]